MCANLKPGTLNGALGDLTGRPVCSALTITGPVSANILASAPVSWLRFEGGGAFDGTSDCGIWTDTNPVLKNRIPEVGTVAMKPGRLPLDGTETMLSGSP